MTARFIPVSRGCRNPPELTYRIEFRSESTHPFWCLWADGSVGARCKTIASAQAYFAGGNVKEAAHG